MALARALINQPRVLLLDEPLGALDLKLRQQMQIELKAIQQQVGITFVFVTHDQEEALTMSDRIAVFNQGKIEQIGTPAEVYEHPATAFVAGFVGVSNLIQGEAARKITGSEAPSPSARRKSTWPEPETPVDLGMCTGLTARSKRWSTWASTPATWSSCPRRRRSDGGPAKPERHLHGCAGGPRPAGAAGLGLQPYPRPGFWRSREKLAMLRRISTALYLRSWLLLLILLGPPLIWMTVIYLGSLFTLLINSFFHLDMFTGQVVREFTLQNYFDLFAPANLDIFGRTAGMAAAVTLADTLIAFPLAYYMARFASQRVKSTLYLLVMIPLWSSYLVRVYAWRLILAKEGILSWFFEHLGLGFVLDGLLSLPAIGGPSLAISAIGMFLVFCYIWLPYMILPIQTALERVPRSLLEASADLGAKPGRDLPPCDPAPGVPRRGGRLDLHLFADPGRFYYSRFDGQFQLLHRPGGHLHPGHQRQHPAGGGHDRRAHCDHGCLSAGRQQNGSIRCALIRSSPVTLLKNRLRPPLLKPGRRWPVVMFLHLPDPDHLPLCLHHRGDLVHLPAARAAPPAGSVWPWAGPICGMPWAFGAGGLAGHRPGPDARLAGGCRGLPQHLLWPGRHLLPAGAAHRPARHRHRDRPALGDWPAPTCASASGPSSSGTPPSASWWSTTTCWPASGAWAAR